MCKPCKYRQTVHTHIYVHLETSITYIHKYTTTRMKYTHNAVQYNTCEHVQTRLQHFHVSLPDCPVDRRSALLVGGAHVTTFLDESPYSFGLVRLDWQEKWSHRVLVLHLFITLPAWIDHGCRWQRFVCVSYIYLLGNYLSNEPE